MFLHDYTSYVKGHKCMYLKVVISKFGLPVSVSKNANPDISGTILAMKISKVGLCRGRSGLSCQIKIQVNTCCLKVRKYRIKFKSSLKKRVNQRGVQNDGGFLQYMLSDHDIVFKTLPGDVFSSTITHMKIFREFMKFLFPEILSFFQILLILRIFSLLNHVQKMT